MDSLHEGLSSPDLVSACISLKAIAVNVSEVKCNPTLRMQCIVCIKIFKGTLNQNNLVGLF